MHVFSMLRKINCLHTVAQKDRVHILPSFWKNKWSFVTGLHQTYKVDVGLLISHHCFVLVWVFFQNIDLQLIFLPRYISFPLETFSFTLDFAKGCWCWVACLSLHHPPKNPTQTTKKKQSHKQQNPPKLTSPNSCKVFCLGTVF